MATQGGGPRRRSRFGRSQIPGHGAVVHQVTDAGTDEPLSERAKTIWWTVGAVVVGTFIVLIAFAATR